MCVFIGTVSVCFSFSSHVCVIGTVSVCFSPLMCVFIGTVSVCVFLSCVCL